MNTFASLGVPQLLVAALNERGITVPTPIQQATLPDSLSGKDLLGRGRTGSGKTYAFLLPLTARLMADRKPRRARRPRALVLAPTRELAIQIEESFAPLAEAASLVSTTIFGGVKQGSQVRALEAGVDVIFACPGRLLDLMGQGELTLDDIEITVLDEADHMADMGFLPMVKRILDRVPKHGQRMLFSATLDGDISVIAKRYLHNPVVHEADSAQSPVAAMEHHVLEIGGNDKTRVVADFAAAPGKTIVFTRTKYGAKKLARALLKKGVPAVDLHGNLSQNARTRNMDAFHSGQVSALIATDIAARGIHVDDVDLVVHADPPAEHKAYLHRSGRTARAGKAGTVVTLVTDAQQQEVRGLMRAAGIRPTVAVANAETLQTLAPGERTYLSPEAAERAAYPDREAQQPAKRSKKRRPPKKSGGPAQQQRTGSKKPGTGGKQYGNRSAKRNRS